MLLLEPKVPKYWPIAAKFGSSRDPASNGGVTFTSTKGDPLGLSGTGTSSYKVKKWWPWSQVISNSLMYPLIRDVIYTVSIVYTCIYMSLSLYICKYYIYIYNHTYMISHNRILWYVSWTWQPNLLKSRWCSVVGWTHFFGPGFDGSQIRVFPVVQQGYLRPSGHGMNGCA